MKDGLAVEFLAEVFNVWKAEKGSQNLTTSLKKAGLDQILPDFFPPNKRSEEYYASFFTEKGLKEIVKFQKAQVSVVPDPHLALFFLSLHLFFFLQVFKSKPLL